MATFNGSYADGLQVTYSTQRIGLRDGSYTFPPVVVRYYKMRGQDVDCGPLTYRTWIVTDTPDYTGVQYTGPRCGATPFAHVAIADTWENLPT